MSLPPLLEINLLTSHQAKLAETNYHMLCSPFLLSWFFLWPSSLHNTVHHFLTATTLPPRSPPWHTPPPPPRDTIRLFANNNNWRRDNSPPAIQEPPIWFSSPRPAFSELVSRGADIIRSRAKEGKIPGERKKEKKAEWTEAIEVPATRGLHLVGIFEGLV